MNEADVIAVLIARLGGSAHLSTTELEAAADMTVQVQRNTFTGEVLLVLKH